MSLTWLMSLTWVKVSLEFGKLMHFVLEYMIYIINVNVRNLSF